jgi:hypothetical protein
MARAWVVAGRPNGDNPTLGSFESWCTTIGGILQYAGLNGFLGNLQEMYRDTADGEDDAGQWADWVGAVFGHFADKPFTVKELAKAMGGLYATALKDDAPYSLGDVGTPDDRAWLLRLGVALHNRKGQVYDAGESLIKLVKGRTDHHTRQKRYQLERIEKK